MTRRLPTGGSAVSGARGGSDLQGEEREDSDGGTEVSSGERRGWL